MRKNELLTLLIILSLLFGFIGCQKNNTEIQDDIIFKDISKLIIAPNNDSIKGVCRNLIFEIISENNIDFTTILTSNNNTIVCDGNNNIITIANTKKVSPLDKKIEILETSNWTTAHNLSLDDFAGKGEKFIGYRSCEYPNGENEYYYGWIKIRLSKNKDTLKIISRASNRTKGKLILTGQK